MKRTLVTDIEADRLGIRAVEIARERGDALEAEGDHVGALRWREKAEAFAEYFTANEAEKRNKANVNLNEIELHAGISDLHLNEPVDIFPGLSIKPTYAHVTSPFVMAFSRPTAPGAGHPGPWKSASGGAAIDLHVQATLKPSSSVGGFDQLNTLWFLAALMRLSIASTIRVPVISDKPFADIASDNLSPFLWPIEFRRSRLAALRFKASETATGLAWTSCHIEVGAAMMTQEGFALAFQTYDEAAFAENPATAMILLWSALEALFRPGSRDITKRLSRMIATYITKDPRERDRLYQQVKELYETRGQMVHAARPPRMESVDLTAGLARQAFMNAFEEGKAPDPEKLSEAWSERIDY